MSCLAALVLVIPRSAAGWQAEGHERAVRLTESLIAGKLPAFFVGDLGAVANYSRDPDVFTGSGLAQLRDQEGPEHYLDWEELGITELPATRSEYLALLTRKRLSPAQAGLLPYGVIEWTQRLTVAFAQHRKWPDDARIRAKCLVYAGLLSHYAADLCQPLHVTVHFDGRIKAGDRSPRTGIHNKVDALLSLASLANTNLMSRARARPYPDLMRGVTAEIKSSRALIDRVYQLERKLPAGGEPGVPDPDVQAFAEERLRAAAVFLANLYLTVWTDSARAVLPAWEDRTPAPRPPGSADATPKPDDPAGR
jgi:hypothetical protein